MIKTLKNNEMVHWAVFVVVAVLLTFGVLRFMDNSVEIVRVDLNTTQAHGLTP